MKKRIMNKKNMMALAITITMIMTGACAKTSPSNGGADQSTTQATNEATSAAETTAETTVESTAETTTAATTAETTTQAVETTTAAEVDWYANALEVSVKTTGNNYRLKQVIDKARSGETVNMAILGGSITEGALASPYSKGYAYQFAESFKETYCSGDNLNFVNAGISGTPSALGVMRYERDVIDALGTVPDLLIIEFAVNDWQEATGGRALESLIYRALSDNENCAVILLFSVSKGKWNLQTDMMPYGKYYSLPMVSMLDAVTSTKELKDSKYFSDEYHPTTYGHGMMKDCLMTLLSKVDEMDCDEPVAIPEDAKKGRQFANLCLLNESSDGVISYELGAFTDNDTKVQTDYFTKGCTFDDNIMKSADSEDPFKVTLTCSTVLLDYKAAGDKAFGNAEIYVDGELVKTVEGYVSGGWNNHTVVLILDEKEAMEHTIEIKMAEDSVGKKFTIYAISYR